MAEFAVGDRVFDSHQVDAHDLKNSNDRDEFRAIVIDSERGSISDVEIEPGDTIADRNPEYDSEENGVEVVFEETLEHRLGQRWRTLEEEGKTIPEILELYADDWGISVRSYTYPESRLIHVADL